MGFFRNHFGPRIISCAGNPNNVLIWRGSTYDSLDYGHLLPTKPAGEREGAPRATWPTDQTAARPCIRKAGV